MFMVGFMAVIVSVEVSTALAEVDGNLVSGGAVDGGGSGNGNASCDAEGSTFV